MFVSSKEIKFLFNCVFVSSKEIKFLFLYEVRLFSHEIVYTCILVILGLHACVPYFIRISSDLVNAAVLNYETYKTSWLYELLKDFRYWRKISQKSYEERDRERERERRREEERRKKFKIVSKCFVVNALFKKVHSVEVQCIAAIVFFSH